MLGKDASKDITTKKQSSATTTSTSSFNQKSFVNGLMDVMPQAVIHSSFTPLKSTQPVRKVVRKLPVSLTMLKNSKYTAMTKDELKTACEEVFSKSLNVSVEEAEYLEESTRQQSHSLLWYDQRAGRITASMFGKVARATPDSPPNSLIDTLMQKSRFNSAKVPALQWGLSKEVQARTDYIVAAKGQHVNLEYFNSGLHVNPSFPHLGATPDGIVSCECCGKGLIEIKCPFSYKDQHPCEITDPKFYMKCDEAGELRLSHDHDYYFQVQGQLAVCNMEYCDFICWTPLGFHTDRIVFDPSFFFDCIKPALDKFFIEVMLPELLTGVRQSKRCKKMELENPSTEKSYCWCGGKDEGRMVACDNDSCPHEWFHYQCVRLTRKPRGKWFCSEKCRKSDMQSNSS